MEPLWVAELEDIVMTSSDGISWWCHPIFAIFVGDYPEQVLATGVKTGKCPGCDCPRDELEDEDEYEYRDLGKILDALSMFDDPDAQVFVSACKEVLC